MNIIKTTVTLRRFYICLLFSLIISACQQSKKQASQSDQTDTISIHHQMGNTTVMKNPVRTVVLDIGALETMKELGIKSIGVSKKFLPEYLDDLRDDPDVSDVGSVIEPDFEAISALNPQLILMSTRQERFYDELNEIAPTVFIGTQSKDYLPSFIQNVKLIARIFNQEELAQSKIDSLVSKISNAQTKFNNDPNKGLFLIFNNGKFSAYGKGSRFGFIHDVTNIKPVMELQDESVHGQRVSNELIAEANPDYLFIVDRNAAVLGRISSKTEVENQLIKQTKAFKNGKIFYLDPNVWFISGGGLTSVNLMVDDVLKLVK